MKKTHIYGAVAATMLLAPITANVLANDGEETVGTVDKNPDEFLSQEMTQSSTDKESATNLSLSNTDDKENCHHSINSETPEHENRGLFFECADSFILKPAEDHEHVFLPSRNTLGIQTVKKTVVSDLMNP